MLVKVNAKVGTETAAVHSCRPACHGSVTTEPETLNANNMWLLWLATCDVSVVA